MKVAELVTTVRDAITVSRVFAEPYEKDGVTVIAAATVVGGAGGGGGHDERGQEGEGGGFGVSARSPSPTCSPASASRRLARRLPSARVTGLERLSHRAACRSSI